MAKYYVYCENHGVIGDNYSDANAASQVRTNHILNVTGPHGKVNVIEQREILKYGQKIFSLRKYKK